MGSVFRARLQQSLEANRALVYAKYVQLATVRPDGRPANRTVVFRGFLGETDSLTFVTDSRTNKLKEVATNPAAELCWYFPESREQYRISGDLHIVTAGEKDNNMLQARQSAWAAMSTGGRTQFTWPQPGLPRTAHDDEFKKPAPGAEEAALDTFCLVVLIPSYVDYVQLFDNRREVLTRDDTGCGWGPSGWVSVNP